MAVLRLETLGEALQTVLKELSAVLEDQLPEDRGGILAFFAFFRIAFFSLALSLACEVGIVTADRDREGDILLGVRGDDAHVPLNVGHPLEEQMRVVALEVVDEDRKLLDRASPKVAGAMGGAAVLPGDVAVVTDAVSGGGLFGAWGPTRHVPLTAEVAHSGCPVRALLLAGEGVAGARLERLEDVLRGLLESAKALGRGARTSVERAVFVTEPLPVRPDR